MTKIFNTTTLRAGLRAAVVVAVAGLLAAPAAQAQQKRGPLVLKSASYFYVGGKIDPKGKGSPIVGHMYVEYMIPQQLRSPYPIVMVHGGNQTGTNFTGTPDGREGWAQYFVRRGYAVYIVDQVARGRSAHWNEYLRQVQPSRLNQVEERFVAPERFPVWPQAKLHTQWPGTGKPGDVHLRPVLCGAGGLDRELREAAGDQSAGAHCADGEDRPVDPDDPFAVGRVRMAGRRPASRSGEDDRRGRAQRSAGARGADGRRAGVVSGRQGRQALRPRRGAAQLRSAARRRARSSTSCARKKPTAPTWRVAGCRRSRRASSRISPTSRSR